MSLKLFGMPGSTCTSRVLTTLYEKNVSDFVIERVNLATGEQKKPEFLKLQPFGVIPVLQDEDLTIFESRAIARYVAEKYSDQGTPLLGKYLKEKARVEEWIEVDSQNYNPLISSIVFDCVFGPMRGLPTDEKAVEANLEKLGKVLDIYEAHLAQNKYLAGDFFSLADVSHIPYTNHLINVAKKGDVITSRKHVNAWWEDISARPSWKKVLDGAAKK